MELWFEWEENNDEHFSFEDSDRFEEDSLCSWISEPESICANWRGWKRSSSQSQNGGCILDAESEGNVESLIELCARTVATYIPFETVERTYPQIPEQMQLRIAFWSFPKVEDDIRLYSCLANGSSEEFQRGEHLVKAKAVKDALQIGFHLSATVNQLHSACQTKGMFNVAVTFDRGRITSSNCTCDQNATWCAHVIALCLFRIHHSNLVCLRAPVSEYLSRLRRDQLQKFAQYLISELPQQILPTAQRLLDELLSSQESAINTVSGAPDPTAGPGETDQSKWCLDEKALHESVRKMLARFCGPGPLVFSDVNAMYLSTTAPPTAAEWSNLLRPLRGREPEGMWNLLYIVRELFHRGDTNAVGLLSTLTEECLANDQVIIWWFDSRSQASGTSNHRNHGNNYRANNNEACTEATKHACAGFCDEIVVLWRLAALNPQLSERERSEIRVQLEEWHSRAVAKARAGHGGGFTAAVACFLGFQPAIEACSLDWSHVDLGMTNDRPAETTDNIQPITLSCGRGQLPHITVKARMLSSSSGDLGIDDLSEGLAELLVSDPDASGPSNRDKKVTSPVPLQEIEEDVEVLCARAEALHVHGYSSEASKLAIRLANNILSDRPKIDNTTGSSKKKERSHNGKSSAAVNFTSTTLVKAAFLCGVLAEDPLLHHLAFKVGMFGLEMPRQPARSKALEVKLTNQESELVTLLKKLPMGGEEMMVIREKANLICQGKLRREAVLPIMLATFIFEMLCAPSKGGARNKGGAATTAEGEERKVDEELAYNAAVCALGMKSNVQESNYPILCEGIRRQRGDLAIDLLLHCKDSPARLKEVKGVLLDKSRYEGPSFVAELERALRQSDQEPKKGEGSEGGTRMKGGFGLPTRRASSGQSSSGTSDSGTDSSRGSSGDSRPRGRVPFGKPSAKVTVTLNEAARDDESGSSSGVDTDSAVNAGSLPKDTVSVKVVELHSGASGPSVPTSCGRRVAFQRDASCSTEEDEALSCSPQPHQSAPGFPPAQGAKEPRTRGDHNLHPRDRRGRRTSDLDGSDIEIDIDDNGVDTGGMSLTPEQGRRQQAAEAGTGITAKIVGTVGLPPGGKNPVSRRDLMAPGSRRGASRSGGQNPVSSDDPVGSPSSDHTSSTSSLGADHLSSGSASGISGGAEGGATLPEAVLPQRPYPSTTAPMPCIPAAAAEGAAGVVREGTGAGAEAVEVPQAVAGPSGESGANAGADDADGSNGRSNRRHGNRGPRRRKKGKKSAVNQATEAEAHFMFELAKTVLSKAGGASTSSVFSQTPSNTSHPGPHRGLQLCAFEIGLFALGLHNRTSPNWLSRTYSSHVSWISGQAMEIGSHAIQLLIERWETNLTPSEVASIADRASRSNDPAMVKAAAELALSCLPMAHMLNPGEIQRALIQCREQDPPHLDRACQAVESAARGGGVYPEVLFEVARHWYYLHEQTQASTARSHKEGTRNRGAQPARQQQQQQQPPTTSAPANVNPFLQQIPLGGLPGYNALPPPPYATPEQYVQMQMHQQVTQMMGHYQGGSYHPNPHYGYSFNTRQIHGTQFQFSSAYGGLPPPYQSTPGPSVSQLASRSLNQTSNGPVPYYLNNAYRVGMLALESLSRRTPDDRPNVKFSRNPPCSEDIRWLCTLSARLGTSYLQRFCVSCLDAVVSPFVLHELALDAARHLARSNPAQLAINLRSPNISPLVQKSLTMYIQCIRYHVVNIVQSEYEEFVELLRHARGAFCMVPGGMTQFNDLLQSIRRGYPKKKDLWQMIMTGLAKA